eukprot:GILI01018795.1.p1 GENE.GILI01018795.1~~GILI01018795.1.p1  ORF type:complete len:544 (-),score=78.44 GILI01018795.1:310-1701(-)
MAEWARKLGVAVGTAFCSSYYVFSGTVSSHLLELMQILQNKKELVKRFEKFPVDVTELLPFCRSSANMVQTDASSSVMELLSFESQFADMQSTVSTVESSCDSASLNPAPITPISSNESASTSLDSGLHFRLVSSVIRKKDGTRTRRDCCGFAKDLEDYLQKKLQSKPTTLVPLKLTVYGPSGSRAPQADAPVTSSFLGTVLVQWPVSGGHKGGVLKAYPPSSDGTLASPKRMSWSQSSKENQVSWVFILANSAYEVEPVTSGHMVTVTFAVLKGGDWKYAKEAYFGSSYSVSISNRLTVPRWSPQPQLMDLLRRVSKPRDKTGNNDYVGVLLSNEYSLKQAQAGIFTGCDKLLYDFLKSEGLEVRLFPVVYKSIFQYGAQGDRSSDLVYLVQRANGKLSVVGNPPFPPKIPFVSVTKDSMPGRELLKEESDGDEDDEDYDKRTVEVHFAAALVIKVGVITGV